MLIATFRRAAPARCGAFADARRVVGAAEADAKRSSNPFRQGAVRHKNGTPTKRRVLAGPCTNGYHTRTMIATVHEMDSGYKKKYYVADMNKYLVLYRSEGALDRPFSRRNVSEFHS